MLILTMKMVIQWNVIILYNFSNKIFIIGITKYKLNNQMKILNILLTKNKLDMLTEIQMLQQKMRNGQNKIEKMANYMYIKYGEKFEKMKSIFLF